MFVCLHVVREMMRVDHNLFNLGERPEKRAPSCLGFIGDKILPSYVGIIIKQYKDSHETTRIQWNVSEGLNLVAQVLKNHHHANISSHIFLTIQAFHLVLTVAQYFYSCRYTKMSHFYNQFILLNSSFSISWTSQMRSKQVMNGYVILFFVTMTQFFDGPFSITFY